MTHILGMLMHPFACIHSLSLTHTQTHTGRNWHVHTQFLDCVLALGPHCSQLCCGSLKGGAGAALCDCDRGPPMNALHLQPETG